MFSERYVQIKFYLAVARLVAVHFWYFLRWRVLT
jgi:hypothetical protein